MANRVDASSFWGKANRLVHSLGWQQQPGYLLIRGDGAKKLSEALSNTYYPSTAILDIRVTDTRDRQHTEPGGSTVPGYYTTSLWYYAVSCVNIGPQSPDYDGPYLLELNTRRWFQSKRFSGRQNTAQNIAIRQYNVMVPGNVANPGGYYSSAVTWQQMYDNAFDDLCGPNRSGGDTDPTLPTITEEGANLAQINNPIEIIQYIEQLHNVASYPNVSFSSTVTGAAIELGDTSVDIDGALENYQDRVKYKSTSRAGDENLDYPLYFKVSFQNRYAPIDGYNNILNSVETTKSSTVTLPSGLDPDFVQDKSVKIWSPVFSELRPGSATPLNNAAMATLADEYRDRFLPRITTAYRHLHYIINGFLFFNPSGLLHEIIWRDYGDGDGFVTELRGGRKVIDRLLGEPFSMLSKPLWCFPGIGMLRHPLSITPQQFPATITTPVTTDTSVTATIVYSGGSSTGYTVSARYVGPTVAGAGTRNAIVFAVHSASGTTGYYAA